MCSSDLTSGGEGITSVPLPGYVYTNPNTTIIKPGTKPDQSQEETNFQGVDKQPNVTTIIELKSDAKKIIDRKSVV